MAGKYNLLTIMTLNAAGYDKGISQVSKKTQAFKKGTQEASKSIASSFSSMGNVLGGAVNSQVGMLSSSVGAGVSAFRSMIPAITGVKTALIASGIGAIVVALGAAFGALSSYLTGTEEGSKKLNVIMGYLKGTFNAIIQRVNLMGSALVKLFEGDFKGMRADFEAAFKGGLFDEVKEGAKEGIAFGEEQNRLETERIKLKGDAAELDAKMAAYRTEAKNKDISITEQKKAQLEFKKQDAILDKRMQKYLWDVWQLQEKINISKGRSISIADKELLAEKKVAYYNELTKDAQDQAITNKIDFRLNSAETVKTYTETLTDNIKALESQREAMFAQGQSIDLISAKIIQVKKDQEAYNAAIEKSETVISKLTPKGLSTAETPLAPVAVEGANIAEYINYMDELNGKLKDTETITSLASTAIGSLGNAFVTMAETGEASFKDMVTSMLSGLRSIIFGLLAEALGKTIVNALNPSNPANAASFGLAGIAAAAAGVTAISALWATLPKFANGGIINGSSFSGDNMIARVNSNEMILNQSQQSRLFAIANGSGGTNGEVTFRIEGSTLIGVLENTNRRTNKIR